TVYPGLIDAAVLIGIAEAPEDRGAHWNERVHPQVRMADQPPPDASLRKELRSLGFTAAAVYPSGGILRGSGTVIALAGEDEHVLAYDERAAMAVGFSSRGSFGSASYPGSRMGAITLIRQTLYDARWHAERLRVWQRDPLGHEPPEPADALVALADAIAGRQHVLFDVSDELNALRAARIGDDFDLDGILLASGFEFRRLDAVAATGWPLIVPLSYPDRPEVSSLAQARGTSLREMMTWEQAPTNPRRLAEAGATIALTSHRLKKRSSFYGALHKAIDHGLSADDALAALTTTPAQMLDLDHLLGTIEPGKAANLVVVDGSLFDRKPKIRATWVNGRRHEVSKQPQFKLVGKATLRTESGLEATVDIDTVKSRFTLHLPDGKTKAKAQKVIFQHDQLAVLVDGRLFDVEGYVHLTGTLTEGAIVGVGVLPDGEEFAFTLALKDEGPQETEQADEEEDEKEEPAAEAEESGRKPQGDEDEEPDEDDDGVPEQLVYPLGAYGLSEKPQPQTVAVLGATIWTCGPAGIIDDAAMLVRGGRIAFIGEAAGYDPPPDAVIIDASGRHITPGLIDCHSHTGIDGGVNEWSQAVTAEVRIADVIDPDDINWYRELAGGLTAANQLHGSANPIGGQNSVVKLKWSASADEFRVDDALGGIKFALGENVKRSQGRYPNTRMGVEAIIRDAFTAAVQYENEWERYRSLSPDARRRTMPPRRDLELDALVEILEGQRLVHSHSYRQDEILMLIRLAEEYGFTIGTFQHVLEGYKVAEAIAAHGAGASTFSDWWAYKVEVMDAIPYNGALMHEVGVVVSFNSDSSELARRLNTEAAKAVRYGGVEPHEALKFVTLNPARQLRIEHRCGSLEAGKDADFAVFSESPLSTYAVCEQTWIEGARYFDIEQDRELRQWAQAERRRLIQKILEDAHGQPKAPAPPEAPPEVPPDAEGEPDAEPEAQPEQDTPPPPEPPYSCVWSEDE
ncbi:MAG: amidohydrolase family protein, partial [Planctomycetota bacterium]